MFKIIKQNIFFSEIAWWLFIVAFLCGILFSNALLPISLALLTLHSILFPIPDNFLNYFKKKPVLILVAILFLIYLPGIFVTSSASSWVHDIFIKLPFLLFPIVFINMNFQKRGVLKLVLLIFNILVFFVGIASFLNYLLNFQYYNEMILRAKPIPVVTGLNHIYFSMMLSFSALSTLCLLFSDNKFIQNKKFYRFFLAANTIMFVFFLVFIHTISARTGLLAFYEAFIILSVVFLWQKRMYVHSLVLILLIVLTGFLSVRYIGSLRFRYLKTIEDITVFKEKGNINYYSFSTRVEYWKACINIFRENPWLGVGNADLKHDLNQYLQINKPVLDEKNRLDPHNQYLQLLAGSGIYGFVIFSVSFIWIITVAFNRKNFYLMSLMLVVTFSFLGESVLERQAGIAFSLFFILLTALIEHKKTVTG